MSETVILWIIGTQTTLLLVLQGILARSLSAHMTEWHKWQEKFLVEHGGLIATHKEMMRRLEALETRK